MAMYLFPNWLDDMNSTHPSRMLDIPTPPLVHHPSSLPIHHYQNYLRPWRTDNKDFDSTVHYEKDRFLVNLDVQQFSPEEIQVKVVDNCIMVEGKHDEKKDEHGHIFRHFVRKYVLPKEYKCDGVITSLSSDGVLTISAPKVGAIEGSGERLFITQTGPHKAIHPGKKDKENKK